MHVPRSSLGLRHTTWSFSVLGSLVVTLLFSLRISHGAEPPIILDNNDPGAFAETGNHWSVKPKGNPYAGDAAFGKHSGSYVFAPQLPAGRYRVSLTWVSTGRSLSARVPVTVEAADGTHYLQVDQSTNGDLWNVIGEFDLDAASLVRLEINDKDEVCADAVKFEPLSQDFSEEPEPLAPADLVATGEAGAIHLDWSDNTETDLWGYFVYRSESSGSGYTQLATASASGYSDLQVTAGMTYFYVVTAVDVDGNESAPSQEASAAAFDEPPQAPADLVATGDAGAIHLDWSDNTETDLEGYKVYRSESSGSGYTRLATVTASDYSDLQVTAGVTYFYVVTAVDAAGNESTPSNEAYAAATDEPPQAPADLVATGDAGAIHLDWSDNTETDLEGYKVYRSDPSWSGYQQLATVTASSYSDLQVAEGVTYFYVVTAVDAAGNESTASNETYATATDEPPQAPADLVATGGTDAVHLDWGDNTETDLEGYSVYRSQSSGSGYTLLATVATSDYSDVEVTTDTTYFYVVTAVDSAGNESAPSDEASAALTVQSVTLGWDAPSTNDDGTTLEDLAGYKVYDGPESGSYTHVTEVGNTTLHTFESLPSGTYYFCVTAYDASGNESAPSTELQVTVE